MISRRKFLANSIEALIGASVVLTSGCKKKSGPEYQYRVKMIEDLRVGARRFVDYIPKEGYVYDVDIGEKKVHVNLSYACFEERNNLLKYTIEDTTVRIYEKGDIKVWENDIRVTALDKIAFAQKETDAVLKAVNNTNQELFKSMIKSTGLPVFDYNFHSK